MSIILRTYRRGSRLQPVLSRLCSTETQQPSETDKSKLGGFAQAFEKYTSEKTDEKVEEKQTFAALLRNSKFIDVRSDVSLCLCDWFFRIHIHIKKLSKW